MSEKLKKYKVLGIAILGLIVIIIAGLMGFQYFKTTTDQANLQNNNKVDESNIVQNSPKRWSNITKNKFLSGQWTREQYILNNLKHLAQDKNTVLGDEEDIDEVSGTLRMSNWYLKNGQDQAIKNNINDYLKIIYSTKNLNNVKNAAANKSFNLLDSVQVNASEPETVTIDFPAGGFQNYIIHPVRSGLTDSHISLIKDAITDSFNKYAELGYTLKPATIYINNRLADIRNVLADALLSENREICEINMWQLIFDEYNFDPTPQSAAEFKQTLAHEMYHCAQQLNFRAQAETNVLHDEWLIEGGAEYFSNVVYPSVNYEDRWNPEFDSLARDNEIYKIDYPTYIFHQFLANRIGNEGLKALYSSLPVNPGWDGQREAISSIGDIDNLFHQFAKEYVNGTITDTNGSLKNFNPIYSELNVIRRDRQLPLRTKPFKIKYSLQKYKHNNGRFEISVDNDNGAAGRYSTKRGEQAWVSDSMPSPIGFDLSATNQVTAFCERNETPVKTLQTSTNNTSEDYILDLTITAFDVQEDQDSANIDDSLIGNWTINPDSVRANIETMVRRNIPPNNSFIIQDFEYQGNVCFKRDGVFFSDVVFSVDYTLVIERGGEIPFNILLFSSTRGNYSANNGTINFTELQENTLGQINSGTTSFPIGTSPAITAEQVAILRNFLRPRLDEGLPPYSVQREIILRSFAENARTPATTEYTTTYNVTGSSAAFKFPITPYPDTILDRS